MFMFVFGISITINILLLISVIFIFKYFKDIKKGGVFNAKDFDNDFFSSKSIFDRL